MQQHECGTLLDEEDILLGICPVCCEFLSLGTNALGSFEEIVSSLSEPINEEESDLAREENANFIKLQQNPLTGTYEADESLEYISLH